LAQAIVVARIPMSKTGHTPPYIERHGAAGAPAPVPASPPAPSPEHVRRRLDMDAKMEETENVEHIGDAGEEGEEEERQQLRQQESVATGGEGEAKKEKEKKKNGSNKIATLESRMKSLESRMTETEKTAATALQEATRAQRQEANTKIIFFGWGATDEKEREKKLRSALKEAGVPERDIRDISTFTNAVHTAASTTVQFRNSNASRGAFLKMQDFRTSGKLEKATGLDIRMKPAKGRLDVMDEQMKKAAIDIVYSYTEGDVKYRKTWKEPFFIVRDSDGLIMTEIVNKERKTIVKMRADFGLDDKEVEHEFKCRPVNWYGRDVDGDDKTEISIETYIEQDSGRELGVAKGSEGPKGKGKGKGKTKNKGKENTHEFQDKGAKGPAAAGSGSGG